MTLLTYLVFKTIAEIGSFHKAAEVLGLTPSAISHTISSMENELGFTVFTRSKAGVSLTSNGQHILPYINAVLNADEGLRQVVAEMIGLKEGRVKIGCFSSVCTNWMPDIIRSFQTKYPSISIEVFQGTYDDVTYWVKNGIVDFGFLSVSSAGDLAIEPFYEDPLLCIVPKNFEKPDPASDKMRLEEMEGQKFVAQRESTDADVQSFLQRNALVVRSDCHVVDDLSTVAMVEHGFGICIMPELVMKDMHYRVRAYRLEPGASRIIGLVSQNENGMAPAVKAIYRHIIDTYSNLNTE